MWIDLRRALIAGLPTGLLMAGQTVPAQSASDHIVPVSLSAESAAAPRQSLPPGQVWQCLRDGQRIFSDAQCGAGATIRQLSDVNRMDAVPAARGPRYYPPPRDADAAYPTPDADEEPPAEAADPIYVTQAVAVIDRAHRVARTLRPHHHDPRPVQARAAHAAAH